VSSYGDAPRLPVQGGREGLSPREAALLDQVPTASGSGRRPEGLTKAEGDRLNSRRYAAPGPPPLPKWVLASVQRGDSGEVFVDTLLSRLKRMPTHADIEAAAHYVNELARREGAMFIIEELIDDALLNVLRTTKED
jgi:hypothetical protein